MHTSAQAEYTGTLLRSAEARTKVLDGEGRSIPVLWLDIELDNVLHTFMRLEWEFPAGQHAQAHAAARRYPKGRRITAQVSPESISLRATAAHIHIVHQEVSQCQPSP